MASKQDPRKRKNTLGESHIPAPSLDAMPMPGIPSVDELVASGQFVTPLTASLARALRVAIAAQHARTASRDRDRMQ